jgi:DnaA family protein
MSQQQLILDLGRTPEQRFETYFAGPNAEVLASARAFADGTLPAHSLVIHGPPGCGKTHILNSAVHTMSARGLRVHHAVIAQWSERDEGELPSTVDVIVADGDQSALPPALEAALFTWYNARVTPHGGKMIVALRPPLSASEVRDDLRTRLAAGLVVRLLPLDDVGLRDALAAHARARGIVLNDHVLQYLVTRFSRDMGTLTALLDGLDTLSLAEKRAITLPLLRTLIGT